MFPLARSLALAAVARGGVVGRFSTYDINAFGKCSILYGFSSRSCFGVCRETLSSHVSRKRLRPLRSATKVQSLRILHHMVSLDQDALWTLSVSLVTLCDAGALGDCVVCDGVRGSRGRCRARAARVRVVSHVVSDSEALSVVCVVSRVQVS